jgi:hypothetical protein
VVPNHSALVKYGMWLNDFTKSPDTGSAFRTLVHLKLQGIFSWATLLLPEGLFPRAQRRFHAWQKAS